MNNPEIALPWASPPITTGCHQGMCLQAQGEGTGQVGEEASCGEEPQGWKGKGRLHETRVGLLRDLPSVPVPADGSSSLSSTSDEFVVSLGQKTKGS